MSDQAALKELIQAIARERAVDLRGYKPTTLERRVRRRMSQVGIRAFPEYLRLVRSQPGEVNDLLNVVLINVTEFFRDAPAWEVIRTDVLPRLLRDLKPGDSFRAWSAGCASGEEPYSLAILVAELLGPRLSEIDAKIYATDVDEEALQVARRGQYSPERLRRVRREWQQHYFTGGSLLHNNRELRRIVIFGRSDLVSNAPISHCHLILCRNVLIYFDAATQKQILSRLHYALEPGGVLMLGKAETKLTDSKLFRPVNPRWRIFQRAGGSERPAAAEEVIGSAPTEDFRDRLQEEVLALQRRHLCLLDTLRSGVVEMDAKDVITACNQAASAVWGLGTAGLIGKRMQSSELAARCPEIVQQLDVARSKNDPVQFQCNLKLEHDERVLSLSLRAVRSENGERTGMVLNCDDITAQARLHNTIQQLETTGQELQSANQELETTNEELQSTNEELETTNEELQSTNEELETTNEELQSLNEELENMNQELEARSRELNALSSRYEETLQRMPWPVILVDRELRIQLWNTAAQRMFGVAATSVVGVELERLPAAAGFTRTLVRRCTAVLDGAQPVLLRGQTLRTGAGASTFDVQFVPAARVGHQIEGVLIIFGPSPKGEPVVKPAESGHHNLRKPDNSEP